MPTMRIVHDKNFTSISNLAIQDKRLSFKARGLHHLLLSYPDNWVVNMNHLINESDKDGRDAIYSAIAELKRLGYIIRRRVRKNGGMIDWETEVHELPVNTDDDPTAERFPEEATSGKSVSGKKRQSKGVSSTSGFSVNGLAVNGLAVNGLAVNGLAVNGKPGRILTTDLLTTDLLTTEVSSTDDQDLDRNSNELLGDTIANSEKDSIESSVTRRASKSALLEKPESLDEACIPPIDEPQKTADEIKLQWLHDVFIPNYPYRLTESGDRVRNIGKVKANPRQYLRFLSVEAIESGQATDGLRNMLQHGCRQHRAIYRCEPKTVKPKGSNQVVYVLPYVPDPAQWLRNRCYLNEYDLGEPVAPQMPWGDDPSPEFLAYLCTFYLPNVPSYQGKPIGTATAKSWLNAARHNQKRFEDAGFQWEAFQEYLQRQEEAQQVIATAQPVEEFSLTQPEPSYVPDLLTRLRAQYKTPKMRGDAIRRAREAGIAIELLEGEAV